MEAYYIGIDIGGTRIKYGVVSASGQLSDEGTVPSESNVGPERLFEQICNQVDKLKKGRASALPTAIGLGMSGGVDPDVGVVLLPGKFKALEGYPIVQRLRQQYGVPVYADNDGRLAAYAERWYGKAKETDWAVVLTIGTGVGSGVILNGQILIDKYHLFGTQAGHGIISKGDDRKCLTGNNGTGEILCSATALTLQVRSAIQRGIPCVLADDYWRDASLVDFEAVIDACRQGDRVCLYELDVWISNLALLIVNAVHYYAPSRVILSGGATDGADLFLDTLNERVNQRLFRYPADRNVEICVSSMKAFAGVMGAAAMVMDRLKQV